MLKNEDLRDLEKLVNVGALVKIWSDQKDVKKLKVSLHGNKPLTVEYSADNLATLLKQSSNRFKSKEKVEADMFPATDWLLSKGFYIIISASNDYFHLNVKAKDEYKYLVHGMFKTLTLEENGILDLFEDTEGWASTLQNHVLGDVKNSDLE